MPLMVTRRRGEAVDVYDKNGKLAISVKVNELLPGGVVRLEFDADREYTILRDNAVDRRIPGDNDGNR